MTSAAKSSHDNQIGSRGIGGIGDIGLSAAHSDQRFRDEALSGGTVRKFAQLRARGGD